MGIDNFMENGQEIPEEFKRDAPVKKRPYFLEGPRWIEY